MHITRSIPELAQIMALYEEDGWTQYIADPDRLERAIANSDYILIAWENDQLVGILRAVTDDALILYIQDIVVHSAYRRRGIGTRMMERMFEDHQHVREKVAVSDTGSATAAFFRKLGFASGTENSTVAHIRFDGPIYM